MIIIGIALTILLGFSLVNFLLKTNNSENGTWAEILGLSFTLGIGLETVFMFILDLIGIKISAIALVVCSAVTIIILLYLKPYPFFTRLKQFQALFKDADFLPKNLPWLIVFLIICFLLIGSIAKSLYWPTTSYDSVAGYDLMGKVIAEEGKLKVSLFDLNVEGKRAIYPPLIEGSFAFAYLFGNTSSKIITSLTYLALILLFYALLKKYVQPLNAILFTLFLMLTPEMFAHSSLSLTNIPGALYAAIGLINLFIWYDQGKTKYFIIAAILLAMNVWARSDGIVFNAAGLALVGYKCIREKRYTKLVQFVLISFLPFFAWSLYLKYSIGITQDRFVDHLFWDGERIQLIIDWIMNLIFNINLYGLTFYIFILGILLNIKRLLADRPEFLLLIIVSFFLYTAVYYQLDPVKQDPIETLMKTSFKRALFYFVPLVLYYTSTSKVIKSLFEKIETFRLGIK